MILKTGKINQINGKLKTHLRCHKHLLDEVPELRKKNMCSRCGKSYFTKQQKDNCEKRHTKSFDFFCTQEKCGKGFLLKSEFVAHLRVHSGESPFQCNICGYQFKQKTHLTRHTRRKHLWMQIVKFWNLEQETLKMKMGHWPKPISFECELIETYSLPPLSFEKLLLVVVVCQLWCLFLLLIVTFIVERYRERTRIQGKKNTNW